jgi:GTP pyrophosphokinase
VIVAMAEDLRVIFIKLADRLHNVRTLVYHPKKEKREKIALETLNLFSPIADSLGLYDLEDALNEECFKILDPTNYKRLKKEMDDLKPQREAFIKTAKEEIIDLLK